jgi:hypothetical protein
MWKILAIVPFLAAFLLTFSPQEVEGFWRPCNATLRPPDRIDSPACSTATNRCYATRGEVIVANVTISSPQVHQELLVENWVQLLGIWILLPSEYPHDKFEFSRH